MRKIFLVVAVFLLSISAYGQTVEVSKSDSPQPQIEQRVENNLADTLMSHALDVYSQRVMFGTGAPSGTSPLGKVYNRTSNGHIYGSKNDGTWIDNFGNGDVTGAASSTDNAIVRFDGTGGKTIQNSLATIDDSGSVNIPTGQAYKINSVALAKGDIGLGNVDNTSDANKPVSTAQQTALDLKVVSTRAVNTSSPITGGGDLSSDRTIACATCGVIGTGLNQFASTTSAQLAGVLSDESGSGLAIFQTSPTIITPTIASFTNATHNHTNAAGGGQLTISTFSSTTGSGAVVGAVSPTFAGRIYANTATPTTAASGAGSTGSAVVEGGSTDLAGSVNVVPGGTGIMANGTLTITFSTGSAYTATSVPACVSQLVNSTGTWNARATAIASTPATTSVVFNWDNNSVALSSGSTYKMAYHCFGK